jgi:Protein of unknown function (DUF1656)
VVHDFPELVVGGVLVAPFVKYAAVALVLLLLLRRVLQLVPFESLFINPPVAFLSIYVIVLAILIVLV